MTSIYNALSLLNLMGVRMRFTGWLLPALLWLCHALLSPAHADDKARSARPLTLGIVPYTSTRSLLAAHGPLARSLETALQQPVQIVTAPDYDQFVRRLAGGEYDLVISAPHFARLAVRDYGYNALLVHKAPIRGILVASRQQPLNSQEDLRGKSIAIVDRSALMVILGAATLAEMGLREGRDYQFVETVNHASALQNALSGKSVAALINQTALMLSPADTRRDTQVWRELVTIPGQFYLAHNRLTESRQKEVRAALLAFERSDEGKSFFEKTGNEGFRDPTPADNTLLDRALPETRRQLGTVLP